MNYPADPIFKGQRTKASLEQWFSENVLPGFWDTKPRISDANRYAANFDTFQI
jgi:hypothetical protein